MAVEIFTHKGKRVQRITAEHHEAWMVSVDLGQSQDFTAIAVMQHVSRPIGTYTVKEGDNVDVTTQNTEDRYFVPFLERLPLGTSYPQIIRRVTEVLSRPQLSGCELILDVSGVGAPVGDLFVEAGLEPVRITITGGSEVTRVGGNRWHVPKVVLISSLDAKMHCAELKIASELKEAPALKAEMADFRRHVTEAGRATFSARSGANDDLVLACAMPCWWADQRRGRRIAVGYARGHY